MLLKEKNVVDKKYALLNGMFTKAKVLEAPNRFGDLKNASVVVSYRGNHLYIESPKISATGCVRTSNVEQFRFLGDVAYISTANSRYVFKLI